MQQLLEAAPFQAGGQKTTETATYSPEKGKNRKIFGDAMVNIFRVSSFAKTFIPKMVSSNASITYGKRQASYQKVYNFRAMPRTKQKSGLVT